MKRILVPPPRRRRFNAQEQSAWVRQFRRSGLTVRQFATEHSLGYSTLTRWLSRKRAGPASPPIFQSLPLENWVGPRSWAVELQRRDGSSVRVAAEAPLALVALVLGTDS